MKVKGNLLFSNQSFADEATTAPIIINLDAVSYIGACQVMAGLNTGEKICVVFDDDNRVIIDEKIEDIVIELWCHGED